MRISDDRYSRDRLRFDIALRFIRHEARTHTIRAWTGLTDDRIRKLYRSYLADPRSGPTRHRGKSPQQVAFFTRTPRLRAQERSAREPVPAARRAAGGDIARVGNDAAVARARGAAVPGL